MTTYEILHREWQHITDADKLNYLLKEKLKNADLKLKNSSPTQTYRLVEMTNEGFEFKGQKLMKYDYVTLQTTLKRHVEIDFEFVRNLESDGSILLKPIEGRISKVIRSSDRISVKEKEIHATNFRIPKDGVQGGFGIKNSLTNQVIFDDFKNKLMNTLPGLEILNAFDPEKGAEFKYLKDSEKKIFVSDIENLHLAAEDSDTEFLNADELVKNNSSFMKRVQYYRENGIASFAIVPIVSRSDESAILTVGYILCASKEAFPNDVIEKMEGLAGDILFRMAEANSVPVKVSQEVVNISRGGVALKITDKTLNRMIPEKKKMIFDLVFSKQTPLRFQADVCHIDEKNNSLIAGVAFRGIGHTGSGTGNLRRYEKYLESLKQAN
ncbi:MAG: DUF1577 domain-containing protein [Spirochaetia bacterium]|nr:DUF1577 domain-containing protein [Spirochaetia bacterium]